ncbi:MAG: TetR/AcrR family transcriptional regulator [bacterium]
MGDNLLKRKGILDASYDLMLKNGYDGTGIQDIIDSVGITKGCLYYYFKSKRDIAVAVIDEIIKPAYNNLWGGAFISENPIRNLCDIIDDIYKNNGNKLANSGCPVGNLALELSGKDKILSEHVNEVMILWQSFIEMAFDKAKALDIVKPDLNSKIISGFIVGSFEGCIMISKSSRDKEVLRNCFSALKNYLCSFQI